MKFGIMPELDAATFNAMLENVHRLFPTGIIKTLEIGVHKGDTSRAIRDKFISLGRSHFHIGIDNQRDFKMESPFPECKFIVGDSRLVYNQVQDNSIHLLFIDGNHNYPSTVLDYMLYKSKIVENGFILFHDCGKQINQYTDYQGEGDKNDPDMWISCRKAVSDLGLLDNARKGWRIIIDAADESKPTGGIVVIKKQTFSVGDSVWYMGGEQPVETTINIDDIKAIVGGKQGLYSPMNQTIL